MQGNPQKARPNDTSSHYNPQDIWGGTDYKRAARWRHSRLVGSQTQQQFATRAPLAKDMRGLESFIEPIKIIEALVEFAGVFELSLLPLLSGGGCMEAVEIRDEEC
ncbi:GM14803 [Drosophila sechellia]|uniref:GM14803 n=1 Tax=Drosophila sechellia TaxID=7238 RepID=B4HUY8_DROSE|nr:GM14803 [Drosophila sechellia]